MGIVVTVLFRGGNRFFRKPNGHSFSRNEKTWFELSADQREPGVLTGASAWCLGGERKLWGLSPHGGVLGILLPAQPRAGAP